MLFQDCNASSLLEWCQKLSSFGQGCLVVFPYVIEQTIIETKSPILGNPRSTFVNITSAVANGEISFFGNPVSLNVNEPADGQMSNVSLLVMRDGVSGPATVSWRVVPVTSTFTLADASPWNGTIFFQTGRHSSFLYYHFPLFCLSIEISSNPYVLPGQPFMVMHS